MGLSNTRPSEDNAQKSRDAGNTRRPPDPPRASPPAGENRGVYVPSSHLFRSGRRDEDSAPAVRRTRRDLMLALVVRCHPCGADGSELDLDLCNGDQCHHGTVPATRSLSERATFRLILPEAIAIGVRLSHASRTGLDPWRIAP